MIRQIWIEKQDALHESTEVTVEFDDNTQWSASFATVNYLHRQMETSRSVTRDIEGLVQVRFVAIETPHVIVDALDEDTIEDTIDNMVALGVFESVFVHVHDDLMRITDESRHAKD